MSMERLRDFDAANGSDGCDSTGAIVNNGTLQIDKSSTLSIAGNITGTGAFVTTGGVGGTLGGKGCVRAASG